MVVAHAVMTVKNGVTVAHLFNPSGATVELKQGLHTRELYPLKDTDVKPFPSAQAAQLQHSAFPFILDDSPMIELPVCSYREILECFWHI